MEKGYTDPDEKGVGSGQWIEVPWQASKEVKRSLMSLRRQSCLPLPEFAAGLLLSRRRL